MEATDKPQPLAFSVSSLATETTLSKQTIYKEIDDGRLKALRIRGRIVIPRKAVDEWLGASA